MVTSVSRSRRREKRKTAELARLLAALDSIASERPARKRRVRLSLGSAR
jgi:hypothetical protein